MSAVGVLAVMADAAQRMSGVSVAEGHYFDDADVNAMCEARDVVAELIEAARPFVALLQDHVDMDEHLNLRPAGRPVFAISDAIVTVGDLRALTRSLARCKGAQA